MPRKTANAHLHSHMDDDVEIAFIVGIEMTMMGRTTRSFESSHAGEEARSESFKKITDYGDMKTIILILRYSDGSRTA